MSSKVKCDTCLQDYDTLKRIPKFLSCFHTFCLSCLQSRVEDDVITCPTCSDETTIKCQPLEKGLQTNFYIMNQVENSSSAAATESSEVEVHKERYYWCSPCNVPIKEGEATHETHETSDMETEDGREMAEIYLKSLLVTCKSTWNGSLSKYRESESALKSAQISLQFLEQQINSRHKEGDRHMKQLQKNLSEVGNHLSKTSDCKQQTGEEMYNLFQSYNKLMKESKNKKPADFEVVRNAVVSLEIKTSGGKKLTTPLFDSALLNIPVEGTSNGPESHILTTLSFLILMATQQGQWTTHVESNNPSSDSKKKADKQKVSAKKNKKDTTNKETSSSKTEPSRKDSKTGAVGKQLHVEDKKQSVGVTTTGKGSEGGRAAGARPKGPQQHQQPVFNSDKSRPIQGFNKQANPPRFHNTPRQEDFNISPPIPMPWHDQPVIMPSLTSLQNKKAFFVLAVNGKQYGNVVIELRPDLAPVMCQRFAQCCMAKDGPSYQGTVIYQMKPKTCIMGGRLPGPENLYMADTSPLKKTRGAIFLRLKRDFEKTQCSIVSTEFCIHLDDEKPDNSRTSTVFGYVCDGLAVCDAISHMDCNKDHIAISSAGIVG